MKYIIEGCPAPTRLNMAVDMHTKSKEKDTDEDERQMKIKIAVKRGERISLLSTKIFTQYRDKRSQ